VSEGTPALDIALQRRQAAKVLGTHSAWEVLKYNLTYLLFVKCISVSFLWVLIAVRLLYVGYRDYVVALHQPIPEIYVYHVIAALFHWANRPLFDRLVEAKAKSIESQKGG